MERKCAVNLIYFGSMLTVIAVRILFATKAVGGLSALASDAVFSLLVQTLAMGVIPIAAYLAFLKRRKTERPFRALADDFGYTAFPSRKSWLIALAISLLSSFIVVCVSTFWQTALNLVGFNRGISSGGSFSDTKTLFYELIFTATLPAVFEELANRGLLFSAYKNDSPARVVTLTALMFALMHTNVTQFGYTFVAGLISGATVYCTKSIYPAMLAHFVNNGISVLRNYGAGTGNFFNYINEFYGWLMNTAVGIICCYVLFVVAVFAVIILTVELSLDGVNTKTVGKKTSRGESGYACESLAPRDADFVGRLRSRAISDGVLTCTVAMTGAVTAITLIWGFIR